MDNAIINLPERVPLGKHSPRLHHTVDRLMRYARSLGYGDVHTKIDSKTGLHAIIAVHNLKHGPAIGGCRMVSYQSIDKAWEDALRLGYMMSYKAAINNLPHGGAKAVIIKPAIIKDREAYFEKFGEFVNELGGNYLTAVDSGTSPAEMDIIARKTKFVTCTSNSGSAGDPSPLTALGVRRGIEAAVKFKLQRDFLDGVHVAIQGVGHVGYALAKDLSSLGAKLTVSDVNNTALERCADEFQASVCSSEEIFDIQADVFSPCAFGSIINRDTIQRLQVKIIAGAANNQLAHHKYGTLLLERDIVYAPDFLINAGGLIHVAVVYDHGSLERSLKQINHIYDTVYQIFERSVKENRSTNDIAEKIARDRLF
jgi:leucine dehydrogenase